MIKKENIDENIESQSSNLNDSDDINKNNFQAKELSVEPIKKVIELLLIVDFKIQIYKINQHFFI